MNRFERLREIMLYVFGIPSLIVFIAAMTGTPPSGTVMEDCTVYGVEEYGHPVQLDPDTCEKTLESQERRYGVRVPKSQRPDWARFVLNVAEFPLRLFK